MSPVRRSRISAGVLAMALIGGTLLAPASAGPGVTKTWVKKSIVKAIQAHASSADHDGRYFTEGELQSPGTLNAAGNPVHWSKLTGVPAGFADGTDDGAGGGPATDLQCAAPCVDVPELAFDPATQAELDGHRSSFDHDGRYFSKQQLTNPGTLNANGNPVDWTKLKNVPAGFADGTDDTGGTASDLDCDSRCVGGWEIAGRSIDPEHIAGPPMVDAWSFDNTPVKGSSGFVVLPLEFERFDTHAMHSTIKEQERLIAPIDGVYQFHAIVRWSGGSRAEDGWHESRVHAKGPGLDMWIVDVVPQIFHTDVGNVQTFSGLLELRAGDYVFLEATHNILGTAVQGAKGHLQMLWAGPSS